MSSLLGEIGCYDIPDSQIFKFPAAVPQNQANDKLLKLGCITEKQHKAAQNKIKKDREDKWLAGYHDSLWHAKTYDLQPPRLAFEGATPGVIEQEGDTSDISGYGFFKRFCTFSIIQEIVRQTNLYAKTWCDKMKHTKGRPKWIPVKIREMLAFFGICILMGIKKQPSIRNYREELEPFLLCNVNPKVMSRQRFESILRCIYLVEKCTIVKDPKALGFDMLAKTRWLLTEMTKNFQAHFNPGEYICVDEMMVPYSGRYCYIKQYMKSKPIRYGIKIWAMCCSGTKYIHNLEVYLGKAIDVDDKEQNGLIGQGVVLRLCKNLYYQNHTCIFDNFFTSPKLLESLLQRGIYSVGTVRQGRRGFPTSLNCGNKDWP